MYFLQVQALIATSQVYLSIKIIKDSAALQRKIVLLNNLYTIILLCINN